MEAKAWHSPVEKRGSSDVAARMKRIMRNSGSSGKTAVGETGASCYGGRLLQGRFMQNYNTDGKIANSSCIQIHQ